MEQLSAAGKIKITVDKVALLDFRLEFSDTQRQFIDELETTLRQTEFNPIDLKGIHQLSPLSEKDTQLLLAYLLDEGRIVQIDRDKFLHTDVIQNGEARIREYLAKKLSATVSELKEVLNTSRKWAIPILNYYDKIGLTSRHGDLRELNKG